MANSGPSSAGSAFIARRRRSEAEIRFAYGFGRQLVALETTSFFRIERARGDDADRRVILDLNMNDKKKSPEERITHDLHPVLVMRSAPVSPDLRQWIGEDGRGFLERQRQRPTEESRWPGGHKRDARGSKFVHVGTPPKPLAGPARGSLSWGWACVRPGRARRRVTGSWRSRRWRCTRTSVRTRTQGRSNIRRPSPASWSSRRTRGSSRSCSCSSWSMRWSWFVSPSPLKTGDPPNHYTRAEGACRAPTASQATRVRRTTVHDQKERGDVSRVAPPSSSRA